MWMRWQNNSYRLDISLNQNLFQDELHLLKAIVGRRRECKRSLVLGEQKSHGHVVGLVSWHAVLPALDDCQLVVMQLTRTNTTQHQLPEFVSS